MQDIHYGTSYEPLGTASEPYFNVSAMPLPIWRPWEADLLSQFLGTDVGEGDIIDEVPTVAGISG